MRSSELKARSKTALKPNRVRSFGGKEIMLDKSLEKLDSAKPFLHIENRLGRLGPKPEKPRPYASLLIAYQFINKRKLLTNLSIVISLLCRDRFH